MSKESTKDFISMLNNSKDMPKLLTVTDPKTIKCYGGDKMYFAPPVYYDKIMKRVPIGKLITISDIREFFAKLGDADFTDPMTAGVFVNIVAWASFQRTDDKTPYWRTLKSGGELNAKYPGGVLAQKVLLESEGHTVISKGIKNLRYFVSDYENSVFNIDSVDLNIFKLF